MEVYKTKIKICLRLPGFVYEELKVEILEKRSILRAQVGVYSEFGLNVTVTM